MLRISLVAAVFLVAGCGQDTYPMRAGDRLQGSPSRSQTTADPYRQIAPYAGREAEPTAPGYRAPFLELDYREPPQRR